MLDIAATEHLGGSAAAATRLGSSGDGGARLPGPGRPDRAVGGDAVRIGAADRSKAPRSTRSPSRHRCWASRATVTLLLPSDADGPLPSPELDPVAPVTDRDRAVVGPGRTPRAGQSTRRPSWTLHRDASTKTARRGRPAGQGGRVDRVPQRPGRHRPRSGRPRSGDPGRHRGGGRPAAPAGGRFWSGRTRPGSRSWTGRGPARPAARSAARSCSTISTRRSTRSSGPGWADRRSASDGWLRGPHRSAGGFDADSTRRYGDCARRWIGGRPAAKPGPVRTCFRLTPDDDEEDEDARHAAGWLLEFLLQPVADPSVLVPAEHVWAEVAGAADPVGGRPAGGPAGRPGPGQPAVPGPRRRAATSRGRPSCC